MTTTEKAKEIVDLSTCLTLEDVMAWGVDKINQEYFRLVDLDASPEIEVTKEE